MNLVGWCRKENWELGGIGTVDREKLKDNTHKMFETEMFWSLESFNNMPFDLIFGREKDQNFCTARTIFYFALEHKSI